MSDYGANSGHVHVFQKKWVKELAELGYTNDLPRPCNVAIQTTIASIRAEEIHSAIQAHERIALANQQDEEPGDDAFKLEKANLSIRVLIAALTKVARDTLLEYQGAEDTPPTSLAPTSAAIPVLPPCDYVSPPTIHLSDGLFTSPSPSPLSVEILFSTPNCTPKSDVVNTPLSTSFDLDSNIKENPLLNLDYLTKDELIEMNIAL
ncbi:unnamed protein product [Calypogeia fissa]